MDFMTAQGKRQPLNELLHAHLLTLHVTNKLRVIQFFFLAEPIELKSPAGICCRSQKERCLFAFSVLFHARVGGWARRSPSGRVSESRTLELGAPADGERRPFPSVMLFPS